MIKAIETRYAGYHFRSRLEARWAVFFDSLKIKYRYEPEGFKFSDECYLPDFYLPDLKMFAEVKPDASFDKAVRFSDAYNARKCEEMLAGWQPTPLLYLQGPPGENVVQERRHFLCQETCWAHLHPTGQHIQITKQATSPIQGLDAFNIEHDWITAVGTISFVDIPVAVNASRSARFD